MLERVDRIEKDAPLESYEEHEFAQETAEGSVMKKSKNKEGEGTSKRLKKGVSKKQ